ncbi:MAG: long-chain fatty acid--CoA ligase, partial [Kiloniellales bacterium]|nr:long-chain fatty acid--CoA ligase [Kiloniellales bacterium]
VSENRPEWLIADIAVMSLGAITVPAYTTSTESDFEYILSHSEAVGIIVSNAGLAAKLLPAAEKAPNCRWAVTLEVSQRESSSQLSLHRWDEVRDQDLNEAEMAALVEDAKERPRDGTACFIYTSGTGGSPKGVMLSHGAMLCNCMGAYELLRSFNIGEEVFLSFLPLSHAYEHTVGQFFPISIAGQIYYAEGIDQLLKNLGEARPTIMTAVPRLYESMHQRILRGVEREGGLKARLFHKTVELGLKRLDGNESLGPQDLLLDALLDRMVRNKVRKRFGGRLKAMISGGAALNPDIGRFFTALGLRILQGYGQTEAGPVVSANPPQRIKMDTVGPPLAGVEVTIAKDGEILVRGELLMSGYWRDEEATAETLKDGWLHTGDIGEIDEDGYLKITDRKKDIVVLSGGDNLAPSRVESFLTLQPEIAQAMVYGDKRPHLVALLVPEPDFLLHWAKQNGKGEAHDQLMKDPDLAKALAPALDRVNRQLSNLEKVRRIAVADEAFSTDNGLMTPTMKIRRHKIKERYGERLESLYR